MWPPLPARSPICPVSAAGRPATSTWAAFASCWRVQSWRHWHQRLLTNWAWASGGPQATAAEATGRTHRATTLQARHHPCQSSCAVIAVPCSLFPRALLPLPWLQRQLEPSAVCLLHRHSDVHAGMPRRRCCRCCRHVVGRTFSDHHLTHMDGHLPPLPACMQCAAAYSERLFPQLLPHMCLNRCAVGILVTVEAVRAWPPAPSARVRCVRRSLIPAA